MDLYIQYHNIDKEGLPLSDPPFADTELGIYTRRPEVRAANGRVFLIAGLGQPRRYFLWETFRIESVKSKSTGLHIARGSGWQLAPPAELSGSRFEAFLQECANFVSFRRVTDSPFARTLTTLAERFKAPGEAPRISRFLRRLSLLTEGKDRDRVRRALERYEPVRALSIRQPNAEAIMRGIKKIEYRAGPTTIRGRFFIYASHGRYTVSEETDLMKRYRINDVECDELPRGVLIGSAEIYKCNGGDWHLRKPERMAKFRRPTNKPQPVWFDPF